jgi:hypothetical protein
MQLILPQPPAKPWYREPWPWLLMAGPALVIVAGVITSIIAFRGSDGLIAEDYYKQGLAINQLLHREQRAAALHVGATAQYLPDAGRLRLQMSADQALPAVLKVRFAHATRAGMDRTAIVHLVQAGLYEGTMRLPEGKRWVVTVEAQDWRISGSWNGVDAIRIGAAPAQP